MLSNFPTYFLFILPILVSMANWIEKLLRDFLWGRLGDEPKLHLVNWMNVCTPLYLGGLGIRSLLALNQALLGKWLWRYVVERREAYWGQVVDKKVW
jgi:hypothetical protein